MCLTPSKPIYQNSLSKIRRLPCYCSHFDTFCDSSSLTGKTDFFTSPTILSSRGQPALPAQRLASLTHLHQLLPTRLRFLFQFYPVIIFLYHGSLLLNELFPLPRKPFHTVLVYSSCYSKVPQTGWLMNSGNLLFTVLEI